MLILFFNCTNLSSTELKPTQPSLLFKLHSYVINWAKAYSTFTTSLQIALIFSSAQHIPSPYAKKQTPNPSQTRKHDAAPLLQPSIVWSPPSNLLCNQPHLSLSLWVMSCSTSINQPLIPAILLLLPPGLYWVATHFPQWAVFFHKNKKQFKKIGFYI